MTYEEKQYIMDMTELEDATIKDFEEALVQLRTGPGIDEDVSEEYDQATDLAIKLIERELRAKEKQKADVGLVVKVHEADDLQSAYNYGYKEGLDDVKAEIRKWYWQADKQAAAKDPCVIDVMIDLFIRTIDKYMKIK